MYFSEYCQGYKDIGVSGTMMSQSGMFINSSLMVVDFTH